MLPPDFNTSILDAQGIGPPFCRECFHSAVELGTCERLCVKYGAYVYLYSSCSSFERRVGSDSPIMSRQDAQARFRGGLVDLRT